MRNLWKTRHLAKVPDVSVNICSEDLLAPTIFVLKCDEKLEYFLAQIFAIR